MLLSGQKLDSYITLENTLCKWVPEKRFCFSKNGIISRSDGNIKHEYFHFWVIQTSPFSQRSWKRNIWGLLSQKFTEWAPAPHIDFHMPYSSDIMSVLCLRTAINILWIYVLPVLFHPKLQSFPIFSFEHSPIPGHLTGHHPPFFMTACGSWETV